MADGSTKNGTDNSTNSRIARVGVGADIFSAITMLTLLCVGPACDPDELAASSEVDPPPPPSACDGSVTCGAGNVRLDAGVGAPPGSSGPDAGPSLGVDGGSPASEFLNVAGTWRTTYRFDLSSYLFGISTIAGPLDFLDQAIAGNVNTGIPAIDAFVVSIVKQYIPAWVATVIGVLNTTVNLFDVVEASGTLTIAQDRPATPAAMTSVLRASETWQTLVVLLIQKCPRGRQDPNYPACAREMISAGTGTGRIGNRLTLGVEVKPIAGILEVGRPEAGLVFSDRQVDMDLRGLVLLLVDLAIEIGTNTEFVSLQAALHQIVDCPALAVAAGDFAATTLGLPGYVALGARLLVEEGCASAKRDAISAVTNSLGGIGVGWEALDFDQRGRAIDRTPGDGLRSPEEIQRMSVQDTIDGTFRFVIRDPLSGEWEGLR